MIAVFCLPIWSSDLFNSEHYNFGSDQAEAADTGDHPSGISEVTETEWPDLSKPVHVAELAPDLLFWSPVVTCDDFALESTVVYGFPPTRQLRPNPKG